MPVNPELRRLVHTMLQKRAFVAGGDPAMDPAAAAGGEAPPGGDPMAGGAPPGGDPMAGGGGAPPAGGGGDPMAAIAPMIQQMVQQAVAQQGGGAAGAGAGAVGTEKMIPKIDINVEIPKILKLLARMADALKIPIPAQDMVTTSADMQQVAMGQDPATAATAPQGGAIQPPQPIEPIKAAEWEHGRAVAVPDSLLRYAHDDSRRLADVASALLSQARARQELSNV